MDNNSANNVSVHECDSDFHVNTNCNSKGHNSLRDDGVHLDEGKKKSDEEIKSLEFDFEEHAFQFYSNYAKNIGFAVRKDDTYHDEKSGIVKKVVIQILDFAKKDLYNHIDKDKRAKIQDGDAIAALSYLQAKSDNDPIPFTKFIVTSGGGIRTTSIYEGINSFIKRYVQNKNSLFEFLQNFERAIKEYRHNELMSDFKTKFSDPVLTTALYKYEVAASKIYTRNKFFDVRKELENIAALNVIDRNEVDNNVRLKINKFGSPSSEYVVLHDKSRGVILCDCHQFESCGIPCSHIFCAMKYEHMEVIPDSLVCKRWTKSAKSDFISAIEIEDRDTSKLDLLRTGAVAHACNNLYRTACKYMGNYSINIDSINKLTEQIEKQGAFDKRSHNGVNVVGDPDVVKTKGVPHMGKNRRKRRHCSHCKRTCHYVTKCPILKDRD
ncbi:Zinc finger, PMZ-type [Sesbania bispinosa]|nr:Zinc finger, PMZ-type [Sesbania bispinosa]